VLFCRGVDGVWGQLVHIFTAAANSSARIVYHRYEVAAGAAYVMLHIGSPF
jgi:hypothetical protein